MSRFVMYRVTLVALVLSAIPLRAGTMHCAGVLGNSGEQGATLVRFGTGEASGLGIAFDRYGTLWDRGGKGVLNRYAVDGRLLATYPLAEENPNRDADVITLAGDTLLLRLGSGLYALPIDAPAGAAPKRLEIECEWMSLSSRNGWVAAATRKGEVFLVDPAGERKMLATLPHPAHGIELAPDGAVYVKYEEKFLRIAATDSEPVLAGPVPGERAQFLGGAWFGQSWASTIRRFDTSLHPAPGVVLGGNSGSFIGHVDEQAEVVNGRGLAQVSPGVFAVSGLNGIVHLLHWSAAEQRMMPLRRIGAVRECNALALDRDGRVWYASGSWEWNDGPTTPMHFGIPPGPTFAGAMLESDVMVMFGQLYGKPGFFYGKLTTEVHHQRVEESSNLPEQAAALVPLKVKSRNAVMLLTASGKAALAYIAADGKYEQDAGSAELATATPVKQWTSLATSGSDHLLGAADGAVLDLTRDGERWRETSRWNSWGDAATDKFGSAIHLSADSGRLWVSDTARHRVLCFDIASKRLLASFGAADVAGDSLNSLNAPRTIASRGGRAVVYDAGNQRILKLELTPD